MANGYPNAKNIHDVQYLIISFSCITGMSGFFAEFGSWNDIDSYLFIIYVTPDVLWIQAA
uniref:Uncharacterized protein n=1 Tax=Salix viminalis TaxID=40686 RepID=A0A6N2MX77_SALVM